MCCDVLYVSQPLSSLLPTLDPLPPPYLSFSAPYFLQPQWRMLVCLKGHNFNFLSAAAAAHSPGYLPGPAGLKLMRAARPGRPGTFVIKSWLVLCWWMVRGGGGWEEEEGGGGERVCVCVCVRACARGGHSDDVNPPPIPPPTFSSAPLPPFPMLDREIGDGG